MSDADRENDRRIARGAAALLAFGLDMAPEQFFRRTRGAAAEAEARQILLAVIRRAMDVDVAQKSSIARLGIALGRDRTTVAHAIHKIEAQCEDDPDLDAFVEEFAALTRRLISIGALVAGELDRRLERSAACADPLSPPREGG
jgi:hypothetical protein